MRKTKKGSTSHGHTPLLLKSLGKKISHLYLKNKLTTMWRVSEETILIDLIFDYYVVNFYKEENLQKNASTRPMVYQWIFSNGKKMEPKFCSFRIKRKKIVHFDQAT